jgi:hypothetical protein
VCFCKRRFGMRPYTVGERRQTKGSVVVSQLPPKPVKFNETLCGYKYVYFFLLKHDLAWLDWSSEYISIVIPIIPITIVAAAGLWCDKAQVRILA